MRIYGWILREGRSDEGEGMSKKIKKICLSILKDIAFLCLVILFILAIGVVTNIAMGVTINEYMMAI